MNITWNFPLFLSFWIFGILVLFLWLKNRDNATEFRDVLPSLLLGAVIGVIAAYAGDSARLNHWVLWIAYAAGGFYLTYRLLNKQYTTKSMAWLLIGTLIFSSCSDQPNDKNTKFVDGKPEYVWDSISVNQFGNPEMTARMVTPKYAEIQPTWGQAFYYAFKAGYVWWMLIGIILLGFSVFLIVKEANDKPLFARKSILSGGINIGASIGMLIFAGASFYGKPSEVRWSNKKLLDQSYYEQVVQEHGSSKPIWDSLYVNHLILGSKGK